MSGALVGYSYFENKETVASMLIKVHVKKKEQLKGQTLCIIYFHTS